MKPILIILILIALAIAAFFIRHEKPPKLMIQPTPVDSKTPTPESERPLKSHAKDNIKSEVKEKKEQKVEVPNKPIKPTEKQPSVSSDEPEEDPNMFEAVDKVMKQIDIDKQKRSED